MATPGRRPGPAAPLTAWGGDTWTRNPARDELRWYVFDDRQMYRPGEEVHVKGWLRRIGARADRRCRPGGQRRDRR